MKLYITPGTYVVAVSGGVDSMALLDLIRYIPNVRLIVAHYDHGIRADSTTDRLLVQQTAARLDLPFVYEKGNLGQSASEAVARVARYAFLERVRQEHHAAAIITAHHENDVLETAIINLLRGTGRKGLTALASTAYRIRPFLHISKAEILQYATTHSLVWREDKTNEDERYLRNYVRRRLLPRFTDENRIAFMRILAVLREVNTELDAVLHACIDSQSGVPELDRRWFLGLSHAISREVLAVWLRSRGVTAFDAYTLERVVIGAKTLRPGATIDVVGGTVIRIYIDTLALRPHER